MELSERISIKVRFNEVDSLKIVWHGHYLKYLEDGREAFGEKYGIGYLDVYDAGLATPLVKVDINYKKILQYGDNVIVEARYVNTEAAKVIFDYTLFKEATGEIVATAQTIQVFIDKNGELVLTLPPFYADWKKKWEI
ncbi:MAG: acyl-CoA thioesterase [Bacteroidota bacterium]